VTGLRISEALADLFAHRHLFVARLLSDAQRQTLQGITRGQPQLRALRQIMDQVHGLFDRRCRSDSALEKLAKLRRRVRQFKGVGRTLAKLFSPNLEKALTYLDDRLLPSTSNAVERGNRRFRKMQKTVYRVRTLPNKPMRSSLYQNLDPNTRPRVFRLRSRKGGQSVPELGCECHPAQAIANRVLFQMIFRPSISETAGRSPLCMILWASGPPWEISSYCRQIAFSAVR